mgnify:CR=1 FL=1
MGLGGLLAVILVAGYNWRAFHNLNNPEAMDAAHGHPHNEDGSEMSKEQLAAEGTEGTGHSGGGGWSLMTTFFAASTGLLLLLLIFSAVMKRKTAA